MINVPMIYSPVTGTKLSSLADPNHYRDANLQKWHFNPWTGSMRSTEDAHEDPFGKRLQETYFPGAALPARAKGTMTHTEFDALVGETVESIRKLLTVKGGEYTGPGDDRLAAFKRSADLAGVAPLQCLLIYMVKHFDAFATYVRDDAAGKTRERSEPIDGRLDDTINYCILAKALIRASA